MIWEVASRGRRPVHWLPFHRRSCRTQTASLQIPVIHSSQPLRDKTVCILKETLRHSLTFVVRNSIAVPILLSLILNRRNIIDRSKARIWLSPPDLSALPATPQPPPPIRLRPPPPPPSLAEKDNLTSNFQNRLLSAELFTRGILLILVLVLAGATTHPCLRLSSVCLSKRLPVLSLLPTTTFCIDFRILNLSPIFQASRSCPDQYQRSRRHWSLWQRRRHDCSIDSRPHL